MTKTTTKLKHTHDDSTFWK